MTAFEASRRVGVATTAVTVVRYGNETHGRRNGARCAVKGCAHAAQFFCSRDLGKDKTAWTRMVAVIGYCDTHSALSERFAQQTWKTCSDGSAAQVRL